MSQDPDWVNLNPDESQNSNFYYNAADQQFSLGPVYNREDLSVILGSLKSKCNILNFDYLLEFDEFKDLLPFNDHHNGEKPLEHLAEESEFLASLGKKLKIKEDRRSELGSEKQINKNNGQSEDPSSSGEESSQEDAPTFRNFKNFNFPKAYGYRLGDEELLKTLDFFRYDNYYELLGAYFQELWKETVTYRADTIEGSKSNVTIILNGDPLVELEGKTTKKALEKVSQLLLAFFSSKILPDFEDCRERKRNSRKKLKTEMKRFSESNLEKKLENQEEDVISSDSKSEVRDYKVFMPKKLNEEELRMCLEEVLAKRPFDFGNFLTEMKIEVLRTAINKDKKVIEKITMRRCLNTLDNLFKYHKLVKRQSNSDNILIFSHTQQEGDFKVSIMEKLENGEKKLLASASNSFKSFALYFALSNFFENFLKGSYKTINEVYEEVRRQDNTWKDRKEEKKQETPIDLISQDLLNEIDNYSLIKKL